MGKKCKSQPTLFHADCKIKGKTIKIKKNHHLTHYVSIHQYTEEERCEEMKGISFLIFPTFVYRENYVY